MFSFQKIFQRPQVTPSLNFSKRINSLYVWPFEPMSRVLNTPKMLSGENTTAFSLLVFKTVVPISCASCNTSRETRADTRASNLGWCTASLWFGCDETSENIMENITSDERILPLNSVAGNKERNSSSTWLGAFNFNNVNSHNCADWRKKKEMLDFPADLIRAGRECVIVYSRNWNRFFCLSVRMFS